MVARKLKASSIILAGGKSLRLGYDKVLETVGRRSLVEKVVQTVATLSDNIIIVTASERTMPEFDHYPNLKVVYDMYPGKGPLNGIYTGLYASGTRCNIVVAADMPFLNIPLLQYMIEQVDDFDMVTPRVGDRVEPLHSVYTRDCMDTIMQMFEEGVLGVHKLHSRVKTRYIDVDEITRFDPAKLSFFNINTEKDLLKARKLHEGSNEDD